MSENKGTMGGRQNIGGKTVKCKPGCNWSEDLLEVGFENFYCNHYHP